MQNRTPRHVPQGSCQARDSMRHPIPGLHTGLQTSHRTFSQFFRPFQWKCQHQEYSESRRYSLHLVIFSHFCTYFLLLHDNSTVEYVQHVKNVKHVKHVTLCRLYLFSILVLIFYFCTYFLLFHNDSAVPIASV